MSGFVFVCDAQGRPLMPMSPAYARQLRKSGKATLQPHHAFSVLRLSHTVPDPMLRPVILLVAVRSNVAELNLLAEGERETFMLARITADLRTDLPWRLRRRAGHRRRRRLNGRYRAPRRHGVPFKLLRPSLSRSAWGHKIHRRLPPTVTRQPSISATIRWRAEVIERVVNQLRRLIPISQVLITEPHRISTPHRQSSRATLRERLIAAYGTPREDAPPLACCSYCLTTSGRIEIDHLVPRSRGGTSHWSNLALACATCNERKGDRTPAEAGMKLQIALVAEPASFQHARPYARQTAQYLVSKLKQSGLETFWLNTHYGRPELAKHPIDSYLTIAHLVGDQAPHYVARPARGRRKQTFAAYNHPLSTPLRAAFVRVGATIKRRIQVNLGLARWKANGRWVARVIRSDEQRPGHDAELIRIGMLCKARRAGEEIIGMVVAIHSAGRLTLLIPQAITAQRVEWRRVVVGVGEQLRVLSTDRVLFFRISPDQTSGLTYPTGRDDES